ncbi:MAG: iron-sulfur protein [Herbinix sp.]|jgi:uncharacterized protein (DUF362 family)|nr:iron-sulfur protein [Herbinix sp.]
MQRTPDKAVTTHPVIVQAVSEIVREAGGRPLIGDSPGEHRYHNKETFELLYQICGIRQAAINSGAKLNYDTNENKIIKPDAKILKEFYVMRPIIEADKIINLPKLKTHMLMLYTGAVKNMFGIIPGERKTEYHYSFPSRWDFADALIDICTAFSPTFTIMDSIVGMEGNGPSGGDPRNIGYILGSQNPYELDFTAVNLIGFRVDKVPTVKCSIDRGLCSKTLDDISYWGEDINKITVRNFKKPSSMAASCYASLPRIIKKPIDHIIGLKLYVEENKCISCEVCSQSCPQKAITMVKGKPIINKRKCSKCFCCHELCKNNAIIVKRI